MVEKIPKRLSQNACLLWTSEYIAMQLSGSKNMNTSAEPAFYC